jgi:hypothetical protein
MKNIANCSVARENKREEGHGEEAYTNINILPSIHRLKSQDQNNTVLLITGGHLRLPLSSSPSLALQTPSTWGCLPSWVWVPSWRNHS